MQPPVASRVSCSSLTDSFGPVKLQCSSSLPHVSPVYFKHHSCAHIPPRSLRMRSRSRGNVSREHPRLQEKRKKNTGPDKRDIIFWDDKDAKRGFFFSLSCCFSTLPSLKKKKKSCLFPTSSHAARPTRTSTCYYLNCAHNTELI